MRTIIALLAAGSSLVACAPKRMIYAVCPISVPNALDVPPSGGLQYRRLERGVYGCNGATCAIPIKDWRTLNENQAKCEKARASLVNIILSVNGPYTLSDESMTVAEPPQRKDAKKVPVIEVSDIEKELEKVPIVDPRKP